MKKPNMTKEVAEAFDVIINWAKFVWPPKVVNKNYVCRERYWMKNGRKITAKAMRVKYKTTAGHKRWKWELIEYLKSTKG